MRRKEREEQDTAKLKEQKNNVGGEKEGGENAVKSQRGKPEAQIIQSSRQIVVFSRQRHICRTQRH